MSSREKSLLVVFCTAIFLGVSFFGFNWLNDQRARVSRQIGEHRVTIETAIFAREQADRLSSEVEWLESRNLEPTEGELVPSKLENLANTEAVRAGLSVTRRKILPKDDTGIHFHRAKVEVVVSGSEMSFYRWLDSLQDPAAFRAVTSLRLAPNREDETKIDATIEVEQWYIPAADPMLAAEPSTANLEP